MKQKTQKLPQPSVAKRNLYKSSNLNKIPKKFPATNLLTLKSDFSLKHSHHLRRRIRRQERQKH